MGRLLKLAKLLKVKPHNSFVKIWENAARSNHISAPSPQKFQNIGKTLSLIFIMVCIVHICGCLWICLGFFENETDTGWLLDSFGDEPKDVSKIVLYISGFYFTMVTMSTVGYGDILPITPKEKNFASTLIIIGAFLYAYIIGEFSNLMHCIHQDKMAFDSKMRSVNELMAFFGVPHDLCSKVNDYYKFKFSSKTLFDDQRIFSELPSALRIELVKHRYSKIITKIPLFHGLNDEAVVSICQRMKEYSLMPGEFVMKSGEDTREIIILTRGTVVREFTDIEVSNSEEQFTAEFEEGSFFGDLEFLGIQNKRTITLKTRSYCEFSALHPDDVTDIFMKYPRLKKKLDIYAQMHQHVDDNMAQTDDVDSVIAQISEQIQNMDLELDEDEEDNPSAVLTGGPDSTENPRLARYCSLMFRDVYTMLEDMPSNILQIMSNENAFELPSGMSSRTESNFDRLEHNLNIKINKINEDVAAMRKDIKQILARMDS